MSEHTPQIVVRVDREGTVSAETLGILGAKCLDYVSVLEDLLEATTVNSATTADYDRSVDARGQQVAREVSRQVDGVDESRPS